MRVATYDTIARQVTERLPHRDPWANRDEQDFDTMKRAVSEALLDVWQAGWWPDLMRIEERALRPVYAAATAYTATTEVYYPPTGLYYQALRSTTGNAPATKVGGTWTTNDAYWAVCAFGYEDAEDYDAATDYAVGDQAYYPDTDTVYQMHTNAAAGTAPTTTANWGALTPFLPTLAKVQTGQTTIGDVRAYWLEDPRKYPGARRIEPQGSDTGDNTLLLPWWSGGRVWVEFRLRPPQFTGAAYDATVAYTAADEDETLGGSSGSGGSGGSGSGTFIAVLGRVALRAVTGAADNEMRYLAYLVSESDGQGGEYRFRLGDATADDGYLYLAADDGSGTWHRQLNEN